MWAGLFEFKKGTAPITGGGFLVQQYTAGLSGGKTHGTVGENISPYLSYVSRFACLAILGGEIT